MFILIELCNCFKAVYAAETCFQVLRSIFNLSPCATDRIGSMGQDGKKWKLSYDGKQTASTAVEEEQAAFSFRFPEPGPLPHGRALQVDPMKPMSKPPRTKHLKLKK
jgi:hypothetical protein